MTEPDRTVFLDAYLPYLLQRAGQMLSVRFLRYLHDEGVQASEWRILAVLAEAGPLPVGRVTLLSLLPQPTATHAIGRLQERGAVTRRRDGHDARFRIVVLTAKGRRLADKLMRAATENLQSTLAEAGLEVPDRLMEDLVGIARALGAPRHLQS